MRGKLWLIVLLCDICLLLVHSQEHRIYKSRKQIMELREQVRGMFYHAYDGYLRNAGGYDELRPLTCDGVDNTYTTRGHLTLIDALDTLAVMGNFSEFRRVAQLLETTLDFDKDVAVSVFETNIRVLGGLISAHLLAKRAGMAEEGWPCEGSLLRLAEDVAKRLLPAFETATGMPYGTVNLRYGVPKGETSVTCTAGVGTFLVEFGTLSRLTGNPIYEDVALNAVYSLWGRRSPIGLFGNHIDVQTGRWTALDAGIGAGVDSYFEYLVKGAILLNRPELLEMFNEARRPIDKYLKRDEWYIWANMIKGTVTLPVFQSLEAFWPGLLSIVGNTGAAVRTLARYNSVWHKYGFLPEFYNIPNGEAAQNRESYPLRPELAESLMYLYRSTKNQLMLDMGEHMLESIEFSSKTRCGYATIRNVLTHEKENRMESFFLAETTKYLYLLFDEENFLHNDGGSGERWQTPAGECVIHSGPYIFNTEAHPVDLSTLHCCHSQINDDPYDGLDLDVFRDNTLMQEERQQRDMTDELYAHKCPEPQPQAASHSPVSTASRPKDIAETTVDIEVFDENNNPAGEVLVENFQRIKSERSSGRVEHSEMRNQLTVTDLEEFFALTRDYFGADAPATLDYVIRFMRNFTLDAAFISGLHVLDKNLTTVLGTVIQKEFEERMRTLWELYELQEKYLANANLVIELGLLAFDDDNRDYLQHISLALGQTNGTAEMPAAQNASSLEAIIRKILVCREQFQMALVNTTAMQEFLLKILENGTLEKKRSYKPLLEAADIQSLQVQFLAAEAPLSGDLFANTRRVVDLKQRMIETFDRLQVLMNESGNKTTAPTTANQGSRVAKIQVEMNSSESDNKTATATPASATTDGQTIAQKPETVEESVWSQLVQAILRKTNAAPRVKFDEASMQKKTRQLLEKYTAYTKSRKFQLFTCASPNFIDRFAYREFVP